MEKRTLVALIAVVALGAGAFMVMRAPEKGERRGPAPRPIPEIKAAQVAQIEVTNAKQEKTILEKKDGKWRITAPGAWPADENAASQLVNALGQLSFGDSVTELASKHAELGVAEGKAPRVVVKSSRGATLADLWVGKSIGAYTMVRPAGKNEVWQASGLYPYMLDKEPKSFRNHALFSFNAAEVDRLEVASGADKLELELAKGEKDQAPKWQVKSATGAAPKSTADLDQAQVRAVVNTLAGLHADDFVDGEAAETVQQSPRLTLSVTAKGKAHSLWLGAKKGDDVRVATSDSPTVYSVKKFSLESISHPPIDYRDKTIVKAKEAELSSIQITEKGERTLITRDKDGTWKLSKGNGDADKIKPLVSSFEDLQASGFATDTAAAKQALRKPRGEVVLSLAKGKPVTLKVAASQDDEYYVQREGTPEVYRVKKYTVDRWLKKTADLLAKK